MMQPDGSPKIIDFGIAKNTNRKSGTVAGSFIGTYAYMSPEQADGIPVTFQSDLFSAAVVLYELLTGICPFDGEDIFVTRRKILRDPTPSIPDHILDIPRRLHGVLEKALAKDPETRYQSGIEMAEALEQSIAPVESPQPSASQPSPRPIDDARLQGAASREAQEPKPAPSLGPQRQVGPRAEPRVPSGQGSDSVPAFELIPEQDPKRYMSVLVVVSLITALLGIGLLVHQIQMRIEQSNSMGPSNSVVQGSAQRSLYWQAQSARDRQDYSSAVSLYSKACSDGTAIACQELADMYGTGTGVQRDANLWASYYGKTCDLGYPSYCLDIGKRLEDGDGVPQDYHMAAAFFKKALNQ
jgi:serine/threonine protein kinase